MKCRHCGAEVTLTLIDLGSAPPSNAYLTKLTMRRPEKWFPLKVLVCESCWLVQAEAYSRAAELFNDEYAYFSSFSAIWLAHAEHYVSVMVERFGLRTDSHVVEVASNDGYLLQYVKQRGIPCLGIEPTASTASAARLKGIETLEEFFGVGLAQKLVDQGKQADLIVANNVLAHVPDVNDFVRGFVLLLKPQGVATFEFPHLMQLIEHKQFDTIYHEHFSYLSFSTVDQIFRSNGLSVFDVEELGTHGGSLRVFARRIDTGKYPISENVTKLLDRETTAGMKRVVYYQGFQEQADKVKNDLLAFLLEAKSQGKTVAAYGAAAKGNTLLNYAGIKPNLLPYVCDAAPSKQGKFMPGSRIPIVAEERIREQKPDYVLILPWNIKEEIMAQLDYIRAWGGKFVVPIPNLSVLS
ncbi:MAG: SAM-dependent methyltransferase [Deltaproteobacteria bacterium RBG_13_52_11]|nr:MAG: SAM-dependent methyltransferase [Deltaproteobacteria bacterium RBG_13_52_11]